MNDLAAQISSKSEDRSQQARIPAPATDNIDTNHDVDAQKLAHAPPVDLECDQLTLRLGNPGNHDLNPMTSEEKADAKKLAHAPPVYFEPDQAKPEALRLGNPDNDDHFPMTFREDEHAQNLSDMPPEPPDPDRANPGAFRVGGRDNDDGHTIASGEEVRSHGVTADAFQVSARLVEEDIVVAVVVKDKRGNRKRLIYISIGVLVIFVVVAIVLGVTLSPRSSQSGTTPPLTPAPAPTPAPTRAPGPLERDSMIALIQSRSASTTFSNSNSPQTQSLDWILTDPFSSGGFSDDRLVQRFALATLYYSTNGANWNTGGWLDSKNECDWNSEDFNLCSQESMVQALHLGEDNISGRVPMEIGLLTHLTALYLYNNQLTSSLPSELGLLIQLTNLSLDNNQLTGAIPIEFGILIQLIVLNLHTNQLTGPLPSELGLLKKLMRLHLQRNDLTGSMPPSLCSPPGVTIDINCGDIACTCCHDGDGTSCPFP